MSKRREAFFKFMKKYKNDNTAVAMTALGGYVGDMITELDEKDKQIELLQDHVHTLKDKG